MPDAAIANFDTNGSDITKSTWKQREGFGCFEYQSRQIVSCLHSETKDTRN